MTCLPSRALTLFLTFPSLVGKIWLMLTLLLRMAVVVLAGYPLYQDEQERFVCNTLQPGCSNVCYDLFSPVSHFRFWLIQTVSLLLPYAAFSIYVSHKVALYIIGMHCLEQDVLNFSGAYTVHLFIRTLLEAAFGAVQYFLFGFSVPDRFSCYHSPCTSTVDCYISRPTEKSIMMIFIWGVSSLSFLLSLADLVCALRRVTARNQKNKQLANLCTEKECMLPLPPVQHSSSSPPQNGDGPVANSCQTSDGSCSLLSEEEEEAVLHPEGVPQQSASTNLSSSSSNKCSVAGDLAVKQQSTQGPLCASDQQGTPCSQVRPRLQQDFIKDSALALRPQIESPLGVPSSIVQSKLLGFYPSTELKSPDAQSNYSSTSCLRSKKSEWV
uniref:Gap junction protein n=1 Tax=Zosterops lateralis melanops TaxID=1220523 RepID=A0A8D2NMY8_ZOSLA